MYSEIKTRQFRIRIRVQPKKIYEKDLLDIMEDHTENRAMELHFIQLYIKQETKPGDLCLFLLQKNEEGCHVHPEFDELDSKPNVIYYKEVQKKTKNSFEGHNFDFNFTEPIKFHGKDRLNVNIKASNSHSSPRNVNFIWILGFKEKIK